MGWIQGGKVGEDRAGWKAWCEGTGPAIIRARPEAGGHKEGAEEVQCPPELITTPLPSGPLTAGSLGVILAPCLQHDLHIQLPSTRDSAFKIAPLFSPLTSPALVQAPLSWPGLLYSPPSWSLVFSLVPLTFVLHTLGRVNHLHVNQTSGCLPAFCCLSTALRVKSKGLTSSTQ